ncbi:MAG: DoxX family protein [Bacteroidales bacterium]|jgi:uncharacterized membrane protein YphA (DoxX/SURF4 family)|nr:DoxX family protein [Bacteroidales bacterium]
MEAKKRIFHVLGLIGVFISLFLFKSFSNFEDAIWGKLWVFLGMLLIASVSFAFIFNKQKYTLHAARIFSGIVFIFSGFVKAVDPLGSKYKFIDYFSAWGLDFLEPTALTFGIILSTIELVVGLMLLFKIFPKISTLLALLFMLGFTPITLYLALQENITGAELVHDCGCFGDALILTNWQTFVKNLIILLPIVFIFFKRKSFPNLITYVKTGKLVVFLVIISLLLSVYALRNLPPIDFRPYKIGTKLVSANCTDGLQNSVEKILYAEFVNTKTGKRKEFNISTDYPQSPEWEFDVEKPVREVEIDNKNYSLDSLFPGQDVYKVDNFLFSKNSEERTCDIISDTNYVFLIVAYDIKTTNKDAMKRINMIHLWASENGYAFYGATSSLDDEVHKFKKETNTQFTFLDGDDIPFKTIVRANPGIVLLKNGVILGKWHYRNIPSVEEFEKNVINN